jgi:catechol 2,3-dioxygenase-like lactoylglutathione lyase family enzyme
MVNMKSDWRSIMTGTVPETGRVQLALRVSNLSEAIEFYGKLFDAKPAKLRDGYANFSIDRPPLKLVLIEGGDAGRVDHLGVEVGSTEEVNAAAVRLSDAGLATFDEDNVECCYARQDKVWVHAPDGEPWEVYTVLGDADVMEKVGAGATSTDEACWSDGCCTASQSARA